MQRQFAALAGLRYILAVISILILAITLFFIIKEALAWTNPSAAPPSGGGLITASGNNVGIGTAGPNAKLSFGTPVQDNVLYLYDAASDKYGFGIRSSQLMIYSGAGGVSTGGITFGKFNGTTFTESMRIRNDGNVGIGTTSPGAKLDIAGAIKIADGTQGSGKVLTSNASGVGSWQTPAAVVGVPSGAVMSFNLSSCPSGWTEFTAARGRYIVGLPSGGSLAGTTGTALSNLENRAVGQHNHGITGSPSISDPGHSHTITPGGSSPTPADPSFAWGYSINSRATSIATTGITSGVGSLGTSNAGSVAGTNAPYIQLLTCQKS